MTSTDPRYPVGKFQLPTSITDDMRRQWIGDIEALPRKMRESVRGLNDQQLDTPYRDGGWSVRQVVHHVPDSHMNAYIRLKLALTEDNPTIRPYEEGEWAKLEDTRSAPIEVSLSLLENVHARWVILLRALKPADFSRGLVHPDHGQRNIDWLCAMYSWHSHHHVAHITNLRQQKGW
jgi:DinB family protein